MNAAIARAGAVAILAIAAAGAARAGSYYLCDGPEGSIAITQTREGYANCELRTYPDPVTTAPAEGSKASEAEWAYRDAPSDSDPAPAVAAPPDRPAPPDVRAREFGVVSSAPLVRTSGSAVAAAPAPVRDVAAAVPTASAAATARVSPSRSSEPRVLRGAVYRIDRGEGVTEYTNIKPRAGAFDVLFTYIATCVACDVHSTIDWLHTPLRLDAFREEIAQAAAEYGVEASLLRAVIHAESAFNPLAVSIKGAQGLMQLMPGTASDLGVRDAFDVAQNIRGGARYLAQLLADFGGDEELATAAYNAGPAAVRKYGGVPPYAETRVYVQRVATLHERYGKAL